jgi:hypothetical protein
MTNYRPISLLTVFENDLHTNNILVSENHSFRKGISAESGAISLRNVNQTIDTI